MKIKSTAKFWDIRFSRPYTRTIRNPDGTQQEYQYTKNVHVMVAAESAAKAIELTVAENPDATVHSVNHRGAIAQSLSKTICWRRDSEHNSAALAAKWRARTQ